MAFDNIIKSVLSGGVKPVQDQQRIEGDPSRGVKMIGSRTGNRAQGYYGQLQGEQQAAAVQSFMERNGIEPTPENAARAHAYLMGDEWNRGGGGASAANVGGSSSTAEEIADEAIAEGGGAAPPPDDVAVATGGDSGISVGDLAAAGIIGAGVGGAGVAATRGKEKPAATKGGAGQVARLRASQSGAEPAEAVPEFRSTRTRDEAMRPKTRRSDGGNINFERTPADDVADPGFRTRRGAGEFTSTRGADDAATRPIGTDEVVGDAAGAGNGREPLRVGIDGNTLDAPPDGSSMVRAGASNSPTIMRGPDGMYYAEDINGKWAPFDPADDQVMRNVLRRAMNGF